MLLHIFAEVNNKALAQHCYIKSIQLEPNVSTRNTIALFSDLGYALKYLWGITYTSCFSLGLVESVISLECISMDLPQCTIVSSECISMD